MTEQEVPCYQPRSLTSSGSEHHSGTCCFISDAELIALTERLIVIKELWPIVFGQLNFPCGS